MALPFAIQESTVLLDHHARVFDTRGPITSVTVYGLTTRRAHDNTPDFYALAAENESWVHVDLATKTWWRVNNIRHRTILGGDAARTTATNMAREILDGMIQHDPRMDYQTKPQTPDVPRETPHHYGGW